MEEKFESLQEEEDYGQQQQQNVDQESTNYEKQQQDIEMQIQNIENEENDDITDESQLEYDYSDKSYKRNFGNNIVFKFDRNTHDPAITIGPHWPFFLLAQIFFLFITQLIIRKTYNYSGIGLAIIAGIIDITQVINFCMCALKNPGIVSSRYRFKNSNKVKGIRNYCHPCQIIRGQNTEHCQDCDVCVTGFDHHCPWTGKCIGKGNLCAFYIFLANTGVFMIFNILVGVYVAHLNAEQHLLKKRSG